MTAEFATGSDQPDANAERLTTDTDLEHLLIVGSYTQGHGGQGAGVRALASRAATPDQFETTAEVALDSPTYLLAHPDRPWLFAVGETANGAVTSLHRQPAGQLSMINTVSSGHDDGCHLAFDPSGQFVVVAHYGSGGITSYRVAEDGRLSERAGMLQLQGSGPDRNRQDHSYAHQIVCDGEQLMAIDLGGDAIHLIDIDPQGRLIENQPAIRLPAGFGPRHCVIVGDYLVVLGELAGQLWLARRSAGGWEPSMIIPASTRGPNEPSAIRASDDLIFVANRGPDTVSVFELDHSTGRLQQRTEFDTAGAWPRDLVLTDQRVWVANQNGHVVSVFDRTDDPARYPLAFQLQVPSPAALCTAWFDRRDRIGQSSQL